MLKKTCKHFLLFLSVMAHLCAISQTPEVNMKGKYFFGLGHSLSFAYAEGHPIQYLQYETYPKLGYFVSPKFMPFIGVNTLQNKVRFTDEEHGIRLFALSPGIRYYLTKKNILFVETGMQFGRAKVSDSILTRMNFTQAGLGLGLNFLLLQGIGTGRLSLEILIRRNTVLSNRTNNVSLDRILPYFGTTLALNYILPFDSPDYRNFQDLSPVRTMNLHMIKFSMPFLFTYSYERSITKKTVLNLEFVAADVLGLFGEDRYFVPKVKIEPRYYYGYIKRQQRGQNVLNNSSDFLALEMSYQWLWIKDRAGTYWQWNVIPKWGLRRAVSRHFIVEFSVGANFNYNIEKKFRIEPYPETKVGFVF